jgi:F plasmid transfer operon, TraF, protein
MKRFCFVILAIVFLTAPALSQAAQFAVVGPRALGMGGASVAAVNDSTAVYWNPAALAQFKKVDIRISAGGGLHDHVGLSDKWDEINSIYDQINAGSTDPALATRLDQILTDLETPDTGADIDAHFGLLASIPVGKFSIGLSALGIGYAGMFPTIDTANRNLTITAPVPADSIANNNSAVTAISLISAEPGVALATSIGDKFFIGANAKMMSVKTYVHSEYVRTGDFSTFLDNLDASEMSSTEASIDAGIMFAPSENFSIGVVGRYLNSPSFEFQGQIAVPSAGDVTIAPMPFPYEIELEPQYRAGIALKPTKSFTLSADYDISKNKTLTPGFEDQTAAAGFEITLPKEIFSVRGGAYKNLADDDSNIVYTAGIGIRAFAFRFDVSGAYDFDDREYQGSIDLALRF